MKLCLTWKRFVQNNRIRLEDAIIRFAKQVNSPAASKVNREKYLLICEQLGHEPDPKAMPLEITDFPPIVSLGIHLFNQLRDHYIPGELPLYTGKDLTALPVLFDIYEVTSPIEKEFLLRVINILDTEAVISARNKAKKQKPRIPDAKAGSRI